MTIYYYGYLEKPYLQNQYLGGYVSHAPGSQVSMKLYRHPDIGSQTNQKIYDSLTNGSQVLKKIYDANNVGQQTSLFINRTDDSELIGSQVDQKIYDSLISGSQVLKKIYDANNVGQQSSLFINRTDDSELTGSQVNQKINDVLSLSNQVEGKIYKTTIAGQQVAIFINRLDDSELTGSQVEIKIYSDLFTPGQIDQKIYSSLTAGSQIELIKSAVLESLSSQVDQKLYTDETIGHEIDQKIGEIFDVASQVEKKIYGTSILSSQVLQITHGETVIGTSVRFYPLLHLVWERYLTQPYLTENYLAAGFHALQGCQILLNPTVNIPLSQQALLKILDVIPTSSQVYQKIYHYNKVGSQVDQKLYHPKKTGFQVSQLIYEADPIGAQVSQKLYHPKQTGSQVESKIAEFADLSSQVEMIINEATSIGNQVSMKIYHDVGLGCQVIKIKSVKTGHQTEMVIYNDTQLRILRNFVSRGTPALSGLNWTSNVSLAVGDFATANLNTDVLEQRCQTATVPALWTLTCDTGIPQGAFVDTAAILQHNLSKSARVEFQGSTDALFNTVGFSVVLNSELVNTYYIAPTLPNVGYRYWRFIIQDGTNSASSLYIGGIIFGTSNIMSLSETFENPINFGLTHYKNSIETEGYRSVSNDRALRKKLGLTFSNLRYDSGNYALLKEYWLSAKTDIACLIIPRPTKPSAFAVFAKLSAMAQEEHIAISDYDHYVSFSLDWDESL